MTEPDPTEPPCPTGHHRDGTFRNNDIDFQAKSLAQVLRWKVAAARDGLPKPSAPAPRATPDLAFLHANATAGAAMHPAATWIGHATVLLQAGGLNVLTDPVFSERVSPVSFAGPKRHVAPGLALGELPRIDAVVVSHNHYDHLDAASVDALASQPGGPPLFLVPLGVRAWFEARGIARVAELDWWQEVEVGAARIAFVPAQHWSGRGLGDRLKTLWGGFALFTDDCHAYYTGDTAYCRDFERVHARYAARHGGAGRGFDLALIPIGAYAPRWFMRDQHVDADEAVRIHEDVHAVRSIGIHWGTFSLSDESLDDPPKALAAARAKRGIGAEAFGVLAIGETLRLPRRNAMLDRVSDDGVPDAA